MPKKSRKPGHNYERQLAQEYRDLGYADACTTRYSSIEKDDSGIDLDNTGQLAIQAKCMSKQPNFLAILGKMKTVVSEIKVVHFKSRPGKGKKAEEFVVIPKEDWYFLMKRLDL